MRKKRLQQMMILIQTTTNKHSNSLQDLIGQSAVLKREADWSAVEFLLEIIIIRVIEIS